MIDRREIIKKAIDDCVATMYKVSQPPCDVNDLIRKSKESGEPPDTREEPLYNRHYLPQEVFTEIQDAYMDAYGIRSTWHDYVDTVKEYLEKGGPYYVYGNDHEKKLTHTKPLSEQIGEESAKIVFDLIDKCKHYYRYNADETTFKLNVCLGSSPTSDKDTVLDYYKKKGEPIEIDDSLYDTDEFWENI